MTSHKLGENSKTRMQTMVHSSDGFEIAEVDLRLRGPGDMMGTQQSGILELKIANIIKDKDILSLARHWAKKVLVADPKLSDPKHQPITQTYIKMGKYKNIWNYIS
jgi:ATP-dependent DNA helicase RecG